MSDTSEDNSRAQRIGRLRHRVRDALGPNPDAELSLLSRVLAGIILLSVVVGIVGTEAVVQQRFASELFVFEIVVGTIFITEFALRIWSSGLEPRYAGFSGSLRYIVRPLSLVDLVVIATLIAPMFGVEFAALRLLRLLRMVALAKFGRYSVALRTLASAVSRRRHELSLSVVLASLILLLSATAMYLLEGELQPEAFGSIPRALWWSVATLTTVGYGDVYPFTAVGRLFAGITAIAGIGLIALPAGIMASAFSDLANSNDQESNNR